MGTTEHLWWPENNLPESVLSETMWGSRVELNDRWFYPPPPQSCLLFLLNYTMSYFLVIYRSMAPYWQLYHQRESLSLLHQTQTCNNILKLLQYMIPCSLKHAMRPHVPLHWALSILIHWRGEKDHGSPPTPIYMSAETASGFIIKLFFKIP